MKEAETLQVYNQAYAGAYDEKFLHPELRRPHTIFEEDMLRSLMIPGGRWLDVACGTGYFLSRFPHTERTGLDLSPAMLQLASERNPDAQFRNASFLLPQSDWVDRWDVVSCTGFAYIVNETLSQVRTLIGNLAAWTSPRGSCFLPVSLCDGFGGAHVPYQISLPPFPGRFTISAIVWTYVEESGERHPDLVTPHEEWLIEEFRKYFAHVEVIVYPPLKMGWESIQHAIIARGKR